MLATGKLRISGKRDLRGQPIAASSSVSNQARKPSSKKGRFQGALRSCERYLAHAQARAQLKNVAGAGTSDQCKRRVDRRPKKYVAISGLRTIQDQTKNCAVCSMRNTH